MTTIHQRDPIKILDETASSLKRLVRDLENRESEGRLVTATEIQTIASRLQTHVADLLSASSRLGK
jgi:hypothetical protein